MVGPVRNQRNWIIWAACVAAGLPVGLSSCKTAAKAIFVSRGDESWFTVAALVGILLFLPLIIVAAVKPRPGGLILGAAAVVSGFLVVPAVWDMGTPAIWQMWWRYFGPTLLIGVGFWFAGRPVLRVISPLAPNTASQPTPKEGAAER